MAQRTIETTSLHDRVVREIKNNLNQRDFDIYINPGSEKNAGISGNYPDVIMTTKGEKTVKFIFGSGFRMRILSDKEYKVGDKIS